MTSKSTSQQVSEAGPGDPLEQGIVLHQAGDLPAAERLYREVNRRDRRYGEALRLRSLIAYRRGEVATAIKLARRAVQQQRSNPVLHHTLAEVLRSDDQLEAAITSYRRAWKLKPEREASGVDLAQTLEQAGFIDAAIATWQALLPRSADRGRIYTEIAILYHQHGRPRLAREALQSWREQMPDTAVSWRQLGRAFASIRQSEQAIECYRTALVQAPDAADSCAGLASALQLHGDLDAACGWFDRALDLQPRVGWVYPARVAIRNQPLSTQRQATLEEMAADRTLPEYDRMHMQFALGTLHDRQGEYARAFEHYQAANSMHLRRKPFDAAAFDDRIDRMLKLFDPDFFAARSDCGLTCDKPLFILGMPRSGTSLVEQIIASHPQAHGAGELEDFGNMTRELRAIVGGGKRYPEAVAALDKTQIEVLAQRYLRVLETHGTNAARVTDKMPFNMLWLGMIALLFPGARVVYCRRSALDNCLSCYFQIFNAGLHFSYDLQHLGHVYRQHERLMTHWAQCLPVNMMTVDYEALVANQGPESRRLIEFAGLPWDDRCLAFHTTRRDVHTASTWQVRQPMYTSSVERWRAYEPWLGPLRRGLGL